MPDDQASLGAFGMPNVLCYTVMSGTGFVFVLTHWEIPWASFFMLGVVTDLLGTGPIWGLNLGQGTGTLIL